MTYYPKRSGEWNAESLYFGKKKIARKYDHNFSHDHDQVQEFGVGSLVRGEYPP